MSTRAKTTILYILGVILIIIGVVYAIKPANALPTFFPGHDATMTAHHVKHALAAFLLGIGSFIWGWFMGGPKE